MARERREREEDREVKRERGGEERWESEMIAGCMQSESDQCKPEGRGSGRNLQHAVTCMTNKRNRKDKCIRFTLFCNRRQN
jgi:hypothetical protein